MTAGGMLFPFVVEFESKDFVRARKKGRYVFR